MKIEAVQKMAICHPMFAKAKKNNNFEIVLIKTRMVHE